MNRRTAGRLLLGIGRVLLTIGTIAAFAALVAIGVTIVWAPDHAGAAVVSFLYAGGAVGAGTALLYTGGRLGVAD